MNVLLKLKQFPTNVQMIHVLVGVTSVLPRLAAPTTLVFTVTIAARVHRQDYLKRPLELVMVRHFPLKGHFSRDSLRLADNIMHKLMCFVRG